MLHVGALPGTPRARESVTALVDRTVREASLYAEAGLDGVMLENMHDRPYLNRQVGPEIPAVMTRIAVAVREAVPLPCGVQVLAGANEAALAVALAADLCFMRAEGFVFSHVADEGWMDASAGTLLRERKRLGADHIAVWADIKKKHSAHAVTADVSLSEMALAADFSLTDAVILTGSHTGLEADPEDLKAVRKSQPSLPVYIGSGMHPDNVASFAHADGFIVGSSLKEGGHWENPIDPHRVAAMVQAVAALRS